MTSWLSWDPIFGVPLHPGVDGVAGGGRVRGVVHEVHACPKSAAIRRGTAARRSSPLGEGGVRKTQRELPLDLVVLPDASARRPGEQFNAGPRASPRLAALSLGASPLRPGPSRARARCSWRERVAAIRRDRVLGQQSLVQVDGESVDGGRGSLRLGRLRRRTDDVRGRDRQPGDRRWRRRHGVPSWSAEATQPRHPRRGRTRRARLSV